MNQERINEIVELLKNNDETKKAFAILDEISELLKNNKDFFSFASKQAKDNCVSPMEMVMLAHDFLNNTGKYMEWKTKEEAKTLGVSPEDAKFLSGFELKTASLEDMKKFATIKKIEIPTQEEDSLIKIPEKQMYSNAINAFLTKPVKKEKPKKQKTESEEKLDTQLTLF